VRLSADGAPVVIHDDTVDRTTDGHGAVSRLPLAALRRLDAGSWFSPAFRGERIPTLQETLDWAAGRCGLNLELKPGGGPESRRAGAPGRRRDAASPPGDRPLVEAVGRALKTAHFRGPLILSSFSIPSLVLARAALPGRRIGLLVSRSGRGLREIHRRIGLYALHPHLRLAVSRTIALAHRLGLRVFVWPVNDPRRMKSLVARGADGLMTDDPALFQGADRR
jgi:glycerophosphoryl diester phosphodiesterase